MRKFVLLVLSLAISAWMFARDCYTPTYLDGLNTSAVYSICQDKTGAIWLNTSAGVCRYNGNTLEYVHSPLIMRQFAAGENYIYALMSKSILRFDIRNASSTLIPFPGSPSFIRSSLATRGDSLYVSVGSSVYLWDGGSFSEWMVLDSDITALYFLDGFLLAATNDGRLLRLDPASGCREVASFPSPACAIHSGPGRTILAGLYEGGFRVLDGTDFSILHSGAAALKEVRTFAVLEREEFVLGCVNGVYSYDMSSGEFTELTLSGNSGLPVCSVFTDSDSDIWVGTYYNGVFFSDPLTILEQVPLPADVRAIKSIVEDSRGGIWITTDGFGIFCQDPASGGWECVPDSKGHKFQGSFYDAPTESLWMGEYRGGLFRYDLVRKRFTAYSLPFPESLSSILRKGTRLYMSGMESVFAFDPGTETAVSESISQLDGNNTSLFLDREDNLVLAGNGLKIYGADSVSVIIPRGLCTSVYVCEDNSMWVTVIGKGLARISAEREVDWVDTPTSILAKSGVSSVCPLNGDFLLLGSRSGLFLFRLSDSSVMTFSGINGLDSSIASVKSFVKCSDGSILISGFNGIASLDFDGNAFPASRIVLSIDNFFVNGVSRRDLLSGGQITLSPGESNFSFNLSDYDYSHRRDIAFRWNMTGFDPEWHSVDSGYDIEFMNMRHGRYVLNVEAVSGGNTCQLSVPVVLKPFWYQTLAARLFFLLLGIALTVTLLYTAWSRAVLTEKLHLREKENNDRIRFFQELSLELRTPLNLIVGQLEKFFQDFGARTHGIEDLESIYQKTCRMQDLISDFVDEQNEKSGSDVVGANFLNAATGVVERHLFSGDLDVGVLCSELNMGKTKLSEQMRRCCGKSPREFIEDIRLKHADEMLREGHHRISEVSDRLGYSSPRYFLQRYKAKFGCAPSKIKQDYSTDIT